MLIREKTGKRNLQYSKRHRIYGSKMKMYDLDSVEFDSVTKQPVAMVETKFGYAKTINLCSDEFDCLCNLADRLDVPLLCLVYYPLNAQDQLIDANDTFSTLVHMQFIVIPVNEPAKKVLPSQCRMTETQWVKFLYRLRGLSTVEAEEPLCETWKTVPLPSVLPRSA